MEIVQKTYDFSRSEVDAEERTIVSVITTDAVDRDGEVVLPGGINLEQFRKNPIVMWCHKYDLPPVGRNLWVKTSGNGLVAKTQFARTNMGEELWSLYRDGILRGFSIGFLPERAGVGPPSHKELSTRMEWKGAKRVIRQCTLVEYSATPIPCNPEALAKAIQSKSLHLSALMTRALGMDATAQAGKDAPPGSLLSDKHLDRAVRKLLLGLDVAKLVGDIDVAALIRERLDVARGKV